MPITMAEPVADAVLNELRNNLGPKLAALAALLPLTELPMPVEYTFGHSDFLAGFPVIQVDPVRARGLNEDLRWQDHQKDLEVGIFVSNFKREDITRILDRYARAVFEVLQERRKAGAFIDSAAAFDLELDEADINYGSSYPQDGQFVRSIFIPIRATRRDVERA
jgi:hypothetical protein